MIRLERPDRPQIPLYVDKKPRWAVDGEDETRAVHETESAKAFFGNEDNFSDEEKHTEESFTFSAYKNKPLRRHLTALSHGKCAYCESVFAHVAPSDVEHYRPKSRIDTGEKKLVPGYYWLAIEWTNLLLSCQHCNRSSTHELPSGEMVTLGKVDQFPLSNESVRVRTHTKDVADEKDDRLLLDPCEDDPDEHLLFREDGIVEARQRAGDNPSAMGEASIRVYALQRKGLVERRQERALDLLFLLEDLSDDTFAIHRAMASGDNELLARKQRALQRHRQKLESFLADKAPYLALVRQIIRDKDKAGDFDELRARGVDPITLLN